MQWTDADIDRLPALWAQGLSALKIGIAMGGRYSKNAIIGKVHRLGLPPRRVPLPPGAVRPERPRRSLSKSAFENIEAVTDDLKPLMVRAKQPSDKPAKPKKRKHTFTPLPPLSDTVVTKRAIHNGAGFAMRDIKWLAPEKAESALDPEAVPAEQRKSFFELQEQHCRFPYGQPGAPDFFYCGGERVDPCYPYCPLHCRIAYAGTVKPNVVVWIWEERGVTFLVEHLAEGVTLYLGDCCCVLPALGKVDAVVTDPVWPNVPAGLIEGSERPFELFAEFCVSIPQSVKRLAIEMRNDSDPRFLASIPGRFEFIQVMWCQYAMPGYLGRVLGGNETVYVFGEPIESREGRRVIPSVSPKAQPSDRPPNGHPCSRALIHQEFVVNWCSDEGEIVVDPFMGSGTTGVAAVKLGRKFIGIEIEPKYFDIACRRISDALKQPDMFIERPKPAKQEALEL